MNGRFFSPATHSRILNHCEDIIREAMKKEIACTIHGQYKNILASEELVILQGMVHNGNTKKIKH